MDEVKKMLRAVINGQSVFKQELLEKIDKVDKRVDEVGEKVDKLDKKIDGAEKRIIKRIDKLGSDLAYLEDDAPTIKAHKDLEKRVGKLEQEVASV